MHGKTSASRFLKGAAVAALAAAWAGPALALEISLEENKASRGNIGYVDIHKVFRLFPETTKAKQSYQEIVRQAEEQVNLRKAEVMSLRSDLSRLKLEREVLEKTPIPAAPAPPRPEAAPPLQQATTPQSSIPAPVPAPAVASSSATASPAAPAQAAPAVAASSAPAAAQAVLISTQPSTSESLTLNRLPGMGFSTATAAAVPAAPASVAAAPPAVVEKSSAAAQKVPDKPLEPLVINIPGVTDKPIVVEAPGQSPMPGFASSAGPGTAPGAALAAGAVPLPAVPGAHEAPGTPAQPPPAADEEALKARKARLAELDAKIKSMQTDLEAKEAAFRTHQAQLEKDLIDIENRRSELLLGKIYDAIREVAREAGVSVVVDKSQILFGQNSVDLTDKVVKKLQEQAS